MDIKKTISELSQHEKKVIKTLKKLNGKAKPEEIQKKGDFTQEVEVMNAISWLQSKHLVNVKETIKTLYSLDKEGKKYLKNGLPEKRALNFLIKNKGQTTIEALNNILDKQEIPIAIGWMKRKKWVEIKKQNGETCIEVTNDGKKAAKKETNDEKTLKKLNENPEIQLDEKDIKPLLSRKNLIREKEVITSTVSLNDDGKKIASENLEIKDEISQITSNIIKSGKWKNKIIRPYDIQAFAPKIHGGKAHPLVDLINKIRKIFLEMGFTEIEGNFVESSFWNMDVLFIPQDHPAREMQDTFYCKKPKEIKIKDKQLVDKIGLVHEGGGNTGSDGWGYTFSKDMTEKPLLRTHTTVNTIRYLYNNPSEPCKVFSIGRVFRNENIDSTHIPEFYQIEGIIHEKDANFRQLIGVLKTFYRKMGFEKIRCRPGYFPYTEPSMEVEVFLNGEWMELGGSGIFRPEVTEPLGVKYPVLAWGLGLERLAMLRYSLDDIRKLYISDLEWMRETSLL